MTDPPYEGASNGLSFRRQCRSFRCPLKSQIKGGLAILPLKTAFRFHVHGYQSPESNSR